MTVEGLKQKVGEKAGELIFISLYLSFQPRILTIRLLFMALVTHMTAAI